MKQQQQQQTSKQKKQTNKNKAMKTLKPVDPRADYLFIIIIRHSEALPEPCLLLGL